MSEAQGGAAQTVEAGQVNPHEANGPTHGSPVQGKPGNGKLDNGTPGHGSEGRVVATTETMRQIVKISPFTKWSGCEILTCEEGVCEVRMPFREDLTQHHGFIHGGIIGFLSDNVSAAAAASVVGDVVTADYSVKLLAPGIGDEFYARGEVVKANKRLVAVESRVYAIREGQKKLIAMGTATILPV